WIERGREKLAELGERAKAALQQAFERAGIRRDVPNMEQASPDAIEALRQPQERPRGVFLPRQYRDEDLIGEARTPAKPAAALTPEAAAALERIRAARAQERGEQVRPAPEPADRSQQMLGQWREGGTKARPAGDEPGAVVGAGRLSKAEGLAGAGAPRARHAGSIQQSGKAARGAWVKKQRGPEPQARPQAGLTPEAA